MLKTPFFAKRLRQALALLLALLAGEGLWAWSARVPQQNRPLYIYTHPSGAQIIETSIRPEGTSNTTLGTSPGPFAVENPAAALAFIVRLPGYQEETIAGKRMQRDTVRYPPSGSLQLKPRIPLLVPLIYFFLREPFLAALAVWPLGLYVLVIRPLRGAEDQDRLQQGLFARGQVEAGTRIERYTVVAHLGEGGMASVFEVRPLDTPGAPTLALKLLKPELARQIDRQRFRGEASLLRDFHHPNLVAFYDHGEHLGLPFLVMERLHGQSLSCLIGHNSSWSQKIGYFLDLARALQYLHGHGLVHRDIKPSNAFVTDKGKAVLMDLGIARLADDSPLREKREFAMPSVAGEVMGTAGFMSPEQISGAATDWRSDIYSLGLLMVEVLSGQPPFGEGHPAEILARQALQPTPTLPPLPDEHFQGCLQRWLDADPKRRADNIEEVSSSLQEIRDRTCRNSSAEA